MKSLLLLLVALSVGGYYYAKEIERQADQLQQEQQQVANTQSTANRLLVDHKDNPQAMTIYELSTCQGGQNCYHKFVSTNTKVDRTEADKLMNFFARGKYE